MRLYELAGVCAMDYALDAEAATRSLRHVLVLDPSHEGHGLRRFDAANDVRCAASRQCDCRMDPGSDVCRDRIVAHTRSMGFVVEGLDREFALARLRASG